MFSLVCPPVPSVQPRALRDSSSRPHSWSRQRPWLSRQGRWHLPVNLREGTLRYVNVHSHHPQTAGVAYSIYSTTVYTQYYSNTVLHFRYIPWGVISVVPIPICTGDERGIRRTCSRTCPDSVFHKVPVSPSAVQALPSPEHCLDESYVHTYILLYSTCVCRSVL